MKKVFIQSIFFFICTFFLFCNKDRNENVDISLSINNNSFRKQNIKYVKIVIKNEHDSSIFFPEWLCQGYKGESQTELYFNILKKNPKNNNYEEISERDVDIDYYKMGKLNMKIKPGGKYEFIEELDVMYDLKDTGYYKVQAVIDIHGSYKFKKESSWIEFRIIDK
jgi:hypothetical protein